MNLKTIAEDSKSNTKMTLLFFMLAITIELLMFAHWIFILEPRIQLEADANAQIIAESQGRLISQSLLSNQGVVQLNTVNALMEKTLLLKDPLLNKPFFIGVSIEIDPESLRESLVNGDSSPTEESILSQGQTYCSHCFSVDVGLYSYISDELIGVAYFQVNDAIFEKFKSDIKNKLFVEAIIVLIIAILVWYAAIRLVKQLQIQISVRKAVEAELRTAKELAEAASEAKGQFLANMSHELRTPLNAVIGMGYMVLKGDLSVKQRDHMQKMDSSAHLLLNLINDILDFSKSESGKLELENICFTIDEVLDNLHKLIVNKAEEKQIDLVFSVAKQVPQNLIGDPLRLGQVLLNLCTNALKFTSQGMIVVAIDTIKTQSNITTLKFSVTDTGIGLNEEQQKKLFQSFSQVDSSTTRKYGGTGLGLAICKQLTELMQGEIWVDSQQGVGSTFSFSAVFGLGIQGSENRTLPIELNRMPVLVIDDNLIALEIFTDMLETFSFDVYGASSAEKGLEIFDEMNDKNQPIKLILMDWRLPGINGIEAARLIKERKDLKFMPHIILITAYANDEIIDSARAYLDAYLPKPLTHSYLYDSIATLFADTSAAAGNKTIPIISANNIQINDDLYYPEVKILLVEDNITNQEVAKAILEDTKMHIDIANNGYEAVNKISKNNYDLVLMDIQMPVMDGLEATRILRKDSKNDHLPIIAMTAHALQKDKDECQEVGMNDYIAKPFVVDEFFATLKKWLPEPSIESRFDEKKDESNTENSELVMQQANLEINQPGINLTEALGRFNGKIIVFMRVINNFINNTETLLSQIDEFIKNNNWQQAGKIVHGLKGSSGNICADKIHQLCIKLEQCFDAQNKQQSLSLLEQMRVEFKTVKISVEKFQVTSSSDLTSEMDIKKNPKQQSESTTDTIDKTTVLNLVQQLEELIVENNLGAKIVVEQLNAALTHADFAQELKLLNQYLEDFEFDLALSSINKISQDLQRISV